MRLEAGARRLVLVHGPLLRNAVSLAAFVITYYFAYRSAIALGERTALALWLPSSILLCALLRTPPRLWWLLLLGILPLRLLAPAASDAPALLTLSRWGMGCTEAVLGAALLRVLLRNPFRFDSVRDLALYGLVAVLGAPAIAACGGAFAQPALDKDYWLNWQHWFYGGALANLIVTPALFYWVLRPMDFRRVSGSRWIESTVLLVGLVLSTLVAFEPALGDRGIADTRFYAPVAFLVWAAIRFGMLGASGAMGLVALFAVVSAVNGRGPFAGQSPLATAASLDEFLFLRAIPLYLVAVLIDQARRSATFLQESEQRFRTLADAAPMLTWVAGTDKLCQFFNKGWLDFTGRTLAEELGAGWLEGVHPEDLQQCVRTYESSFDARRSFEMDYRLRRHDGEYRWVLDRGSPRYGSRGEFLGYIGAAVDVTERRQHEAALRASEERYRAVVESQTDFVCRLLPDTTLTFVNEAYCRFLGRGKEQLLGVKLLALLPSSARVAVDQCLAAAAQGQSPSKFECEVPLPNGKSAVQCWLCHAVLDATGTLQEFQAIGHDVTDRKFAEEADRMLNHAARLAVIGELTAMVAHEVNQPLCAILSNAEAAEALLQSDHPPLDELRAIMADICRDDLRAVEVVRRIRALTYKRQTKLQPLDLNKTIEDALRLATGDALRRRVHIRRELAPKLPLVHADGPSLEQVLLNLVLNGMDAMNDTPDELRILTVQTKPLSGGAVEVTVADRGHGIPADKMARLFQSFFTTKPEGMGLGLSIASSIIRTHHGRIWAENLTTGGAAFHFTVPSAARATAASEHLVGLTPA